MAIKGFVKEGDRSCSGGICGREEGKRVVFNRTLEKGLGEVGLGVRGSKHRGSLGSAQRTGSRRGSELGGPGGSVEGCSMVDRAGPLESVGQTVWS